MGAEVYVADEQQAVALEPGRYAELARRVLDAEGVRSETEVAVLFVDEASIAELNARFLGRSGPTDVLAFPIDEEPPPGGRSPDEGGSGPGVPAGSSAEVPMLLGDVVVCPAVAERGADEHGVSLEEELSLLVVHGLLHLLGMDHEDEAEAERMERRERELLARFSGALQSSHGDDRRSDATPGS